MSNLPHYHYSGSLNIHLKLKTIKEREMGTTRPEQVLQFQFILLMLKLEIGWKRSLLAIFFSERAFFPPEHLGSAFFPFTLNAHSRNKSKLNLERFSDTRERNITQADLVQADFFL